MSDTLFRSSCCSSLKFKACSRSFTLISQSATWVGEVFGEYFAKMAKNKVQPSLFFARVTYLRPGNGTSAKKIWLGRGTRQTLWPTINLPRTNFLFFGESLSHFLCHWHCVDGVIDTEIRAWKACRGIRQIGVANGVSYAMKRHPMHVGGESKSLPNLSLLLWMVNIQSLQRALYPMKFHLISPFVMTFSLTGKEA